MNLRILSTQLATLLVAFPAAAGIFCSEPAIAIPDDDSVGVADSLLVTHPETIDDLDVLLDIPHTWVGDLAVKLKREGSGQEVTLVDRPRLGVSLPAGCSGNDLTLRLDDEATATVEDDCIHEGDPAYPLGIYRPGDPPAAVLGAFDGQDLEGTWTLTVADVSAEDAGTLVRWCLIAPTRGVALGGELQVNTYTTSSQENAAVAAAADGTFVVVWQSDGSADTDSASASIQGQLFDLLGASVGGEFQVNSYTTSYQFAPAVAAAADGDFVVVWGSSGSAGTDAFDTSIQGQRFAADGAPLGDQFQVNSYTSGNQISPAVAVNPDGDFVVIWTGPGVRGQRFAAAGSPLGGELQIASDTTAFQQAPTVAFDAGGVFVVVWESFVGISASSILGRRYDSDGASLGGEFQVNFFTTSYQYAPAVAAAAGGDFVVVWGSSGSAGTDADNLSIQGRRFDAAGAAADPEFQVNSYTTSAQRSPAVTVEPGGGFVVVWNSYGSAGTDSDSLSIQGQRYAADGTALGGEFQVNSTTTSFQREPGVAIAPGGTFVVTWESYSSAGTDTSLLSVQTRRYGDPCAGGACIFVDGFESGDTAAWQ